jgi:hypothetical protein
MGRGLCLGQRAAYPGRGRTALVPVLAFGPHLGGMIAAPFGIMQSWLSGNWAPSTPVQLGFRVATGLGHGSWLPAHLGCSHRCRGPRTCPTCVWHSLRSPRRTSCHAFVTSEPDPASAARNEKALKGAFGSRCGGTRNLGSLEGSVKVFHSSPPQWMREL